MKKFLFALLTGLVIAVILCGCDSSLSDQTRYDTSQEIPYASTEIVSIETTRSDGLKVVITDEETIQRVYYLIDAVEGEVSGSGKGYSGWVHALNVYADDGTQWGFCILGERSYICNGLLFETTDNRLLELMDLMDKAYVENRVYEAPLTCVIPTGGVAIDVYISSSNSQKILDMFNEAKWVFATDNEENANDYCFFVKSGTQIYYDFEEGKILDMKNCCYFYLSAEDKAFIDEVLQKGE